MAGLVWSQRPGILLSSDNLRRKKQINKFKNTVIKINNVPVPNHIFTVHFVRANFSKASYAKKKKFTFHYWTQSHIFNVHSRRAKLYHPPLEIELHVHHPTVNVSVKLWDRELWCNSFTHFFHCWNRGGQVYQVQKIASSESLGSVIITGLKLL